MIAAPRRARHRPFTRLADALRSRRRSGRPRGRRVAAVVVVLVVLVGGGWLWLRGSSLVAVEHVSVTGATGPDAGAITSALTRAARQMTTLEVDQGSLRSAVARYAVVAGVRASPHFPHRLQIRVLERVPVATAAVNGRAVTISADGLVLSDVPVSSSLPTLGTARVRAGRLAGWQGEAEVSLLAAAPYALVQKLSQVSVQPVHGLTAQFRSGPVVYFGDTTELSDKWRSLAAVLADPGSAGASYIDVTDPHRPAAGAGSDQASAPADTASTSPGGDQASAAGDTASAGAGADQASATGDTAAAGAAPETSTPPG